METEYVLPIKLTRDQYVTLQGVILTAARINRKNGTSTAFERAERDTMLRNPETRLIDGWEASTTIDED